MDTSTLESTAQAVVASGKGILAMDESHSTCKKRFDAIGVDCTEETRRQYRQMIAPVAPTPIHILISPDPLRPSVILP